MNPQDLAKPFPREAVSWRAQTLTKAGDKALALAYIDARDVMQRLDEVCGVDGWEDSYVETPRGRVIATIRIRIGDQWVSKSDGAGDTAVEGEKGGISDAFKRAAVKWGIGRYLYEIDAPWVPCETYEAGGKKHWKAWKGDPWDFVRGNKPLAPAKSPSAPHQAKRLTENESTTVHDQIDFELEQATTLPALTEAWKRNWPLIQTLFPAHEEALTAKKDDLKAKLPKAA